MPADPRCSECDGTGWKQVLRDGVTAVERCGCVQTAPRADRLAKARIPPRFGNAGFENFSLPRENPIEREALSAAMLASKAYVREYPFGPKKGLMFQGPTGVGKTHLAAAVLHELLAKGFEGLFLEYQKWLAKLRQGYDLLAGPDNRRAYQSALETEVLLMDDLGSERRSDWVEDTVTAVINHRYNTEQALIVTTNLPLPELGDLTSVKNPVSGHYHVKDTLADRVGARAVSRLFEMCHVIRLQTRDYRLKDLRRTAGTGA